MRRKQLGRASANAVAFALPQPVRKPQRSDLVRPSLGQVVERIGEIFAFPAIATRVMAIAADPGATATDLKAIIERDPVLAARILRLANSSALGLPFRVTSLAQAVTYLGTKQIRNVALTATLSDLFAERERIGCYSRSALWRHSVAVAFGARTVAFYCDVAATEDAYLAGLLHDLGIVLEDQFVHDAFCEVIHQLHDSATLCAVEARLLGFDHAALGAAVGERWSLPETVVAAMRWHHDVEACPDVAKPIVHCVAVANLLCTLQGHCSIGRKLVAAPRQSFRDLGLVRSDIEAIATDLDVLFARNAPMLTA